MASLERSTTLTLVAAGGRKDGKPQTLLVDAGPNPPTFAENVAKHALTWHKRNTDETIDIPAHGGYVALAGEDARCSRRGVDRLQCSATLAVFRSSFPMLHVARLAAAPCGRHRLG